MFLLSALQDPVPDLHWWGPMCTFLVEAPSRGVARNRWRAGSDLSKMRWGGRVSGQISTIPVSAELTTGGGGVQIEIFQSSKCTFSLLYRTHDRGGGGGCVDVLGKLCRRFVKPGHFYTTIFFLLFGGGPLLVGAPVHVHMLHMPKSGTARTPSFNWEKHSKTIQAHSCSEMNMTLWLSRYRSTAAIPNLLHKATPTLFSRRTALIEIKKNMQHIKFEWPVTLRYI